MKKSLTWLRRRSIEAAHRRAAVTKGGADHLFQAKATKARCGVEMKGKPKRGKGRVCVSCLYVAMAAKGYRATLRKLPKREARTDRKNRGRRRHERGEPAPPTASPKQAIPDPPKRGAWKRLKDLMRWKPNAQGRAGRPSPRNR